jgi:membrane-associated protease RseP (regulator of RpoE activity)
MTICHRCHSEVIDSDRYCRNCGAQITASVVDLVDTYRLNPDDSQSTTAHTDPTNRFYAPPPAAYAASQHPIPSYQTASLVKRVVQRWSFWLVLFAIISFLTVAGIGIKINKSRSRPGEIAGDRASARPTFEKSVQNALGFTIGPMANAGDPDLKGVFINSLTGDDSPAALAKLEAGDVLTELNDQPVRNSDDLKRAMIYLKPGSEVALKFYRDGETVSSRIKMADPLFSPLQAKIDLSDQGFLGVRETKSRCCIPGTRKWGVEIGRVNANGPADLFGLQAGDVITEFDGYVIRTPNEFARRTRATKPRSKVVVKFFRGKTEQTVELIIGRVESERVVGN